MSSVVPILGKSKPEEIRRLCRGRELQGRRRRRVLNGSHFDLEVFEMTLSLVIGVEANTFHRLWHLSESSFFSGVSQC